MKITDVQASPLFVPLQNAVGAPISLPYADQLASVVFGGYRATIVGGQVTYRDGEFTGALPGRLVRGASEA